MHSDQNKNSSFYDRSANQPIRKTVEESGESIHELNCYCNEQNTKSLHTFYFGTTSLPYIVTLAALLGLLNNPLEKKRLNGREKVFAR